MRQCWRGGARAEALRDPRDAAARGLDTKAGQCGQAGEQAGRGLQSDGDAAAECSAPLVSQDPSPGAPDILLQPLGVPQSPVVFAGCAGTPQRWCQVMSGDVTLTLVSPCCHVVTIPAAGCSPGHTAASPAGPLPSAAVRRTALSGWPQRHPCPRGPEELCPRAGS